MGELVSLDGFMLGALADAYREQSWGNQEELLATIAELLHALLLLMAKAHSKRGTQLPSPLHIRRPNDPKPEAVRPSELFRHLVGR